MPAPACISMSRCRTARAQRLCRGERRPVERHDPACARRAAADHGRIDAGLRAARQFLAALRQPVLCAGQPDLGRQQPLGRAAHPGGRHPRRRIEHRPSGVDANPYLVAATVLAGIRHGLTNRSTPARKPPATAMRRNAPCRCPTTGVGHRGGAGLGLPERRAGRGHAPHLHRRQGRRICPRDAHGVRGGFRPLPAHGLTDQSLARST
jgi:hypothetical protein